MRHLAGILAVAVIALVVASCPSEGQDCAAEGRLLTQWFLTGQVEKLLERFSTPMRGTVRGSEGLAAMSRQVREQAGRQVEVLSESCERAGSFQTYMRLARFEGRPGTITIQWTWDAKGTVVSGFVRPTQEPAPSAFLSYETKIKLSLPFRGEWYVFWGGRTLQDNYHAVARDQRFAYDFLQMKNGSSHTGNGGANEQYYCFGQAILAPAPGKVVASVDSIPDNKPGVRDPNHPFGNHVILDHGQGEFSVLAHLQRGSVRAQLGQTLLQGDTLGLCGNSGNTSEPHLHYHLQNRGEPGSGDGLPAFFTGYTANGSAVGRGEPKRGQTVAPRSTSPAPGAR
jgi:murein DD-endopeptidase MepM/ murein hydrolase activator NlpD